MSNPTRQPAWEALVQGRTYALDFSRNYLAVPRSFDQTALQWASGYVSGSRLSAQAAVRKRTSRFCLFKNQAFCAVGLSSPALEVCDDPGMARDLYDREIYVFLGGATPLDKERYPEPPHHPEIPKLGALRRHVQAIFRPLYRDFIAERFHEKPLRGNGGELLATPSEPRTWFPSDLEVVTSADRPFHLNDEDRLRVNVWPTTLEDDLWAAACLAEPPISLCLSIATEKDALACGFGNITLEEAGNETTLERQPSARSAMPSKRTKLFRMKLEFAMFGRSVIDLEYPNPAPDSTRTSRKTPSQGRAGPT